MLEKHLSYAQSFFDRALTILDSKTRRYATSADPFAGFKKGEFVDVTVAQSILTRMIEKVGRVHNITHNNISDGGEGIEETLQDIANYACILSSYIHHNDKTTKKKTTR